MNTQQLEKKIRKLGIDERRINIGGNGRYFSGSWHFAGWMRSGTECSR